MNLGCFCFLKKHVLFSSNFDRIGTFWTNNITLEIIRYTPYNTITNNFYYVFQRNLYLDIMNLTDAKFVNPTFYQVNFPIFPIDSCSTKIGSFVASDGNHISKIHVPYRRKFFSENIVKITNVFISILWQDVPLGYNLATHLVFSFRFYSNQFFISTVL